RRSVSAPLRSLLGLVTGRRPVSRRGLERDRHEPGWAVPAVGIRPHEPGPAHTSPRRARGLLEGRVAHRDDHLWVIGVDGTGERQIGTLNPVGDLSFAADDRSILVTSGEVLYRVDVATGTPTPIRIQGEPAARIWGGVYSPDGSRILFRRPIGEKADLFTMRADGTDVVRLTRTPMDEGYIDWGTRALDDYPTT